MKFTEAEYEKLYKKLESTFKRSNNQLVEKVKNYKELSNDDLKLLIKKLEYNFKKSGDELIEKLNKLV